MKSSKPRRDVESEVAQKVLDALERGTVPWSKPWTSAAGLLPTSVQTGRAYRGINVWLLTLSAEEAGYASPYWLTFKQATERGGSVRKGEKGTLVVFWKMLDVEKNDDGETTKRIPLLRHYFVFNLEQTENVVLGEKFPEPEEREPVEVDEAIAAIFEGYQDGPTLRHAAGDRAYYDPAADAITLPALEQFDTAEAYGATLFHEMTHSTGHASRLDRFAKNGEPQHFGSERYAREELVAEMGNAILSAVAGISTEIEHSASYIANWLQVLKDDRSLVLSAAQQAQKAVDRILGTEREETR